MAAAMEEHRRYLTKLDSEIGDGDHGTNMHRGFQAALERLEGADPSTPADALKAVSMALISKVGGAAGPLYGTAFLRASTALQGKDEVSAEDAAKGAVSEGSAAAVLRAAAEAAKEGAESTVPLTARKGRASYLGQRAAGHQEPGATSTYFLLDAAARALEGSA